MATTMASARWAKGYNNDGNNDGGGKNDGDDNDVDGDCATSNEVDDDGNGATGDDNG